MKKFKEYIIAGLAAALLITNNGTVFAAALPGAGIVEKEEPIDNNVNENKEPDNIKNETDDTKNESHNHTFVKQEKNKGYREIVGDNELHEVIKIYEEKCACGEVRQIDGEEKSSVTKEKHNYINGKCDKCEFVNEKKDEDSEISTPKANPENESTLSDTSKNSEDENKVVTPSIENENSDLSKAIAFMTANKIMQGYEDGSFGEERAMTRAEYAKVICAYNEYKGNNEILIDEYVEFDDVAIDFWGYEYIQNAYKTGLLIGYGNNIFGTHDTLTEVQALTVICRLLGLTDDEADENGGYTPAYVNYAMEHQFELIDFESAPATRAKVATWLYQLHNLSK